LALAHICVPIDFLFGSFSSSHFSFSGPLTYFIKDCNQRVVGAVFNTTLILRSHRQTASSAFLEGTDMGAFTPLTTLKHSVLEYAKLLPKML
jgi:hypothetical protein